MAGRPKGSKNKATILREAKEREAKVQRMMQEEDPPKFY